MVLLGGSKKYLRKLQKKVTVLPVLFRARFYKHPGQVCPFLIETVGIVKSRTIGHNQFCDPGNVIITFSLT